jgi:hypothetical protein
MDSILLRRESHEKKKKVHPTTLLCPRHEIRNEAHAEVTHEVRVTTL